MCAEFELSVSLSVSVPEDVLLSLSKESMLLFLLLFSSFFNNFSLFLASSSFLIFSFSFLLLSSSFFLLLSSSSSIPSSSSSLPSSSYSLPSSSSSLLFAFVLLSSSPIFHLFFFVLRNLNHFQTFYLLQYQHQSVTPFLLYYFEHLHFC